MLLSAWLMIEMSPLMPLTLTSSGSGCGLSMESVHSTPSFHSAMPLEPQEVGTLCIITTRKLVPAECVTRNVKTH